MRRPAPILNDLPELLTAKEMSKWLKRPQAEIYRAESGIPGRVNLGARQARWVKDDVLDWLNGSRVGRDERKAVLLTPAEMDLLFAVLREYNERTNSAVPDQLAAKKQLLAVVGIQPEPEPEAEEAKSDMFFIGPLFESEK